MAYKPITHKSKIKKGDVTRELIMRNALSYSEDFGYANASPVKIAKICGLMPSNIVYHFGTIKEFHDLIMREAIARNKYIIIAQGIAGGNPIALSANEELQRKALEKVSKCHYMKGSKS